MKNDVSFLNLVTWTASIFQGIINTWYASMWLGRPCRCPMRFKKLHFSPRGKKDFFKTFFSLIWHSLISLFCYHPPLEEDVTLCFNKFESPLHKDTLCQFWLKLAKWFLRTRLSKVVNVFSLCGYYLPLKNSMALNLNKFEIPLPKNTLCHVWLKLAQRFWRRFSKVVNIFSILAIIFT